LDDNLEYIHSVDLKISDELLQWLWDYDRAIIRMKYEEWLTLRRISEILSKSENTIQTQYKRALKKLRDNARWDTCNI
jgi:RNA polymerase sigma factor (sigma-70 family)